jgi:general nucleoside transport system permease protein
MDILIIVQVLDATLRNATPLLLACLAGLFSERAGVFDIGLEGKMLVAAFVSAAIGYHFATVPLWTVVQAVCDAEGVCTDQEVGRFLPLPVLAGMLAGIVASLALSAIHGIASITFKGNQLISGVALNFLASGLTVVVAQSWFGQGGRTPQLPDEARFPPVVLPGALERLRDIAQAGPAQQVYSELLSGHAIIVYLTFALVPLSWWVLYRTRFGLRLRAVGENPAAVDTAGISVVRLRFAALVIAGVLCGIAGAYLATALQAGFVREMTAGRGYIALAALIFAKWKPVAAMWACLLFGLLQAIAVRFQNIDLGFVTLPVQFMEALPYVLTVVILAGFVGKAVPPRAGGEPYVKER